MFLAFSKNLSSILRTFLKHNVFLRKNQGSLQMFLVIFDNSNLDVLINFVLIKKKERVAL